MRSFRRVFGVLSILVLLTAVAPPAAAQTGDAETRRVTAIQQELKDMGYDIRAVDGLYGPNTREAIEAFQADHGLEVTGEADAALERAIQRERFRESQMAMRLWRTTRVYLDALGYDPGEAGYAGARAEAAIAAFVEDHGHGEAREDGANGDGSGEGGRTLRPVFSEALHQAVAAAVRSDARAQARLCGRYVAAQDYDAGLPWCRRAGQGGDVEAQYLVGWMHYYGRGAEQSYPEAFDWYRRAARNGDRRAQTFVGLMYRQGKGVSRDPDAALHWYRRATED